MLGKIADRDFKHYRVVRVKLVVTFPEDVPHSGLGKFVSK